MGVSQTYTLTETETNDAGNYSKVNILWQSTQSGKSHNNYTRTAYYYISINGGAETRYAVNYTLPLNATKTILNETIKVNHTSTGTAKIAVRFWMDTDISAGVISETKSLTLKTIARNSSISSVKNITLGDNCSITWTPASKDYKYKLKFFIPKTKYDTGYGTGNNTNFIEPKQTSSYTYTGYIPPSDVLIPLFSNSNSGTISVSLATYNSSGTQIGGVSTKTFTFKIPQNDAIKPSVSNLSATIVNSDVSEPLLSKLNTLGLCIAGMSKVKLTASASGVQGSTIKKFNISGGTYSTSIQGTSLNWTGNTIQTPGNKTFTVNATDSRNNISSSVSTQLNVYSYSLPTIKKFFVARFGSDSTNVKFIFTGSWSKFNISDSDKENIGKITLEYKKKSDTSWKIAKYNSEAVKDVIVESFPNVDDDTEDDFTFLGATYFTLDDTFDKNIQYEFRLTLSDRLKEVYKIESILAKKVLMDFKSGGKGLGIGKVCESDSLEVALPSIFFDDADFNNTNTAQIKRKTYSNSSSSSDDGLIKQELIIGHIEDNLIDVELSTDNLLLLPYDNNFSNTTPDTALTATSNGLTFEPHWDGSISVWGTATANTTYNLRNYYASASTTSRIKLPSGTYTIGLYVKNVPESFNLGSIRLSTNLYSGTDIYFNSPKTITLSGETNATLNILITTTFTNIPSTSPIWIYPIIKPGEELGLFSTPMYKGTDITSESKIPNETLTVTKNNDSSSSIVVSNGKTTISTYDASSISLRTAKKYVITVPNVVFERYRSPVRINGMGVLGNVASIDNDFDLDEVMEQGLYWIEENTNGIKLNYPPYPPYTTQGNEAGVLAVLCKDFDSVIQIFISKVDIKRTYMRKFIDGVWSNWIFTGSYSGNKLIFKNDFSPNRYNFTINGNAINLYVSCKRSSNMTKGTIYSIATLDNPKISPSNSISVVGLVGDTGTCSAWYSAGNNQDFRIRPHVDVNANTEIEFNLTWNKESEWLTS